MSYITHSDIFPPARPCLLNFPKQYPQLVTKGPNARAWGCISHSNYHKQGLSLKPRTHQFNQSSQAACPRDLVSRKQMLGQFVSGLEMATLRPHTSTGYALPSGLSPQP